MRYPATSMVTVGVLIFTSALHGAPLEGGGQPAASQSKNLKSQGEVTEDPLNAGAPNAPTPKPSATATPSRDVEIAQGFLGSIDSAGANPKAAYEKGLDYLKTRSTGFEPSVYQAHGLDLGGIATETVQILGQIVVDRASAQAYGLLQSKAKSLLGCPTPTPTPTPTPAPAPPASPTPTPTGGTKFPATCKALESLSLRDIASSPQVLLGALGADGVRIGMEAIPQGTNEARAVLCLVPILVDGVLIPSLQIPAQQNDSSPRLVLISELVRAALEQCSGSVLDPATANDGQKALALGALALLQCEALEHVVGKTPGVRPGLGSCPITDLVDQLAVKLYPAGTAGKIRIGAKKWAAAVLNVAVKPAGESDERTRLAAAVGVFFDAVCMTEGSETGCPSPENLKGTTDAEKRLQRLWAVETLARAAIVRDTNTMIVGIRALLPDENHGRGLRIAAGLLNYAETYVGDSKDAADAHAKRTTLLEGLTREMTDRTGRAGDTIASLGGSLRLGGGARLGVNGQDENAFWGPLSLPLGFAVHFGEKDRERGWHIELGVLDLGHYLAFDAGGKVEKPVLADALAPSLTVGRFWGTSMPFFVGVTGGYSPQYRFSETESAPRGAANVGVVVGVYVPFLDFN